MAESMCKQVLLLTKACVHAAKAVAAIQIRWRLAVVLQAAAVSLVQRRHAALHGAQSRAAAIGWGVVHRHASGVGSTR